MSINKKYLKVLLFLLITLSCNMQHEKKEYYKNGKIKSVTRWRDNEQNGISEFYYENGKIEDIAFYKNGKMAGVSKNFYKNGKIKLLGCYKNDRPNGNFYYYDTLGRKYLEKNYLTINGEDYTNQFIFFNGNDTIKGNSNYFSLKSLKDTITEGEEFNLKIKLEASLYKDKMAVIIGKFDSCFKLLDSISIDTLWANKNFEVNFITKNYIEGANSIRGIIFDIQEFSQRNGKSTSGKLHQLYFSKEFYIKKKE